MGQLLWTSVCPTDVADGEADIDGREQGEINNPFPEEVHTVFTDNTIDGCSKTPLEDYADRAVVVAHPSVSDQFPDSQHVDYK